MFVATQIGNRLSKVIMGLFLCRSTSETGMLQVL